DFFFGDARIIGNVAKQRRQVEKAFVQIAALRSLAPEKRLRAARLGILYLLLYLLSLRLDMDRAHTSLLACTVAYRFFLENFYQPADKFFGNRLVQEESFHSKAHLPAVKKAADIRHLHGHIEIGVFHNDHWIAAAEFQCNPLDLAS